MPSLPRANKARVQPAPFAGTPISPDAAAAPARALGSVARGISDVGGVADAYVRRTAEAKNAADIVKGRGELSKAWSDIQSELANEQDTTKWAEIADKRINEAISTVTAGAVAPVVRDRLSLEATKWAQDRSLDIKHQQLARQNQNNLSTLQTAALTAYEAGRMEEAEGYADMMGELGLVSDQQLREFRTNGRIKMDQSQAQGEILQDPVGALDHLGDTTETGRFRFYTHLPDETRRSLMVVARREVSALHSRTIREIMDRRSQGEVVLSKELQGYVDGGAMTPLQMKHILAEQARSGDDPRVNLIRKNVNDAIAVYDPSGPRAAQEAESIETMALELPPMFRDRALSALDKAKAPKVGAGRVSVANDVFRQGFNSGAFGETVKEDGKFVDEESASRAAALEASLQDEMETWLEENPTATRFEVRQKAQEMANASIGKGRINSISRGKIILQDGVLYRFKGGDPFDLGNWEEAQ